MDRRTFLKSAAGLAATGLFEPSAHETRAGGPGLLPLHAYAQQQQQRGKVKITDVKCMIVRGTWDWNLIKIETDSGLYGIGEAYWGWGVKDLVINKLRPIVLGEDPLNVDKLYTKMLMESAGAGAIAGVTVTAVSGIEIALWDLAGRILQTPACNLLGGRFRDRVRFYRTMPAVERPEDPQAWREQVRGAKAEKFGWTAFKFQGDGIPPKADPDYKEPGHDRYTRGLTLKDLRRIGRAMEIVREELGPDVDFGVEAHWKYDVRDAIQMAKAIEPVKPMWLEDPVPPGNFEAMARVTHAVEIPICTGENLYTRDGFRRSDRDAGLRHRPHRHPEIRRPAGGQADSRSRGQLLHLRPRPTIRRARSARSHRATPPPRCATSASTSWRATSTGGRTSSSATGRFSRMATSRFRTSPDTGSRSTRMSRRRTSLPARRGGAEPGARCAGQDRS